MSILKDFLTGAGVIAAVLAVFGIYVALVVRVCAWFNIGSKTASFPDPIVVAAVFIPIMAVLLVNVFILLGKVARDIFTRAK